VSELTPFWFQIGENVEHRTNGICVVKEVTPSGIRVVYEVPPAEFDGETEDTVCIDDLQEVSSYTDDQVRDLILKQLSLLFSEGDTVCLTFIHSTDKTEDGKPLIKNAILPFTEAISKPYVDRMILRNREGWNVFTSMNSLATGAQARKKEFAGAMCSVFADVDFDGNEVLATIRASAAAGEIPPPSAIARSSKDKFQFVWRINSDEFSTEKVESINRALVARYGADPACADVLRVFRVWGLRNCKYPSRPVVELIETTNPEGCYNFADFRVPIADEKSPAPVKPPASESEVAAKINYFDLAAEEAKLHIKSFKKWGTQGFIYEITCPFVDSHTGRKDSGTVIMIHPSAAISFKCQHGHCIDRTWQKDVRPEMERLEGHPLRFGDPVGGVSFGPSAASTASTTVADPPAWGEPQPFDNSLLPVPPFKLDFLPSSLQAWAQDVSERMSVPLDFPGISMLCALAGCVNRRAFVYPKANDKDWKESLSISGAVVSTSGKLKTPTWKTSINPMQEIDIDWQNEYKARLGAYKSELKSYEDAEKLRKKEDEKSRKSDQSDAGPIFASTAAKTSKPAASPLEPEPCRRLVLNDATPEKFHAVMAENPEGLFVYRDEMTGWVAELDQKGREAERSLFLTAMNGNDPYTLDRIGRGSVTAKVSASLFGGFQPEPLIKFLCDTRNINDGMLARFGLLVWPDDTTLPLVDRIVNSDAKDRFRRIIRRLAELRPESVRLHFSPEAQVKFNDWLAGHILKTNREANVGKQSHLSKYRGLLPKLAGLFQLADAVSISDPIGEHLIDLDHLNRAMALLAYLEAHMNRIYSCAKSLEQKAVEALAEHVESGDLSDGFSIRDVVRKCWEHLSKSYVEDAILTLEDFGWLRLVTRKEEGRGRPTYRWEINPALNAKGDSDAC
jgi:hypothetical protein